MTVLAGVLVIAQSMLTGLVSEPETKADVVVETPAPVAAAEKPAAEEKPAAAEKPVAAEAKDPAGPAVPRSVRITAERTDYDRKSGVIMFDRNVFVDDAEYQMHAEQLYVFLDGTNDLKRIVALGGVAITNETRVGTCALATYRRKRSEIEMFGDKKGARARLVESGEEASALDGSRIKFWLDSEQVEVSDPTISVKQEGGGVLR